MPQESQSRDAIRAEEIARLLVMHELASASEIRDAQRAIGRPQDAILLSRLVKNDVIAESTATAIASLADELMLLQSRADQSAETTATVAKSDADASETVAFDPTKNFSTSSAKGGVLGDYQILNEVARGGMGVVYKARQVKLNRIVALKMIRTSDVADEVQVQRFFTEAEAAAKLKHPNIVPVYDVGDIDGIHYYSMEFVTGESLSTLVKREGPLDASEAARLMQATAEAVQHAHEANILHRDLKPGNLLLDQDGQVRVADFGLAKLRRESPDLTTAGQVLGTPAYMPPEQAKGDTEQIGNRADIYSLGATLYFLLTGRPPFQAATIPETLHQVIEGNLVEPRLLNRATPKDLETICLKALRQDPRERYDSAQEFAKDLQRWRNHEPIRARRVSRGERIWKWVRRHPVVAASCVLGPLLTMVALAVFWDRQNATYSKGLVDSLTSAEPAEVPRILAELENYERWANPRLQQILIGSSDTSDGFRAQMHARMALIDDDPSVASPLIADLLEADLKDVANVAVALNRAPIEQLESLWPIFRGSGEESPPQQFRAGLALIRLFPVSPNWTERDDRFLAEQTVLTDAVFQHEVWQFLRLRSGRVLLPLEEILLSVDSTPDQRLAAAHAVAFLAERDEARLGRLLLATTGPQYQALFSAFQKSNWEASEGSFATIATTQPVRLVTARERIAVGKTRAAATTTLLRLGRPEVVLDSIQYDAYPEAAAQFVAACRDRGVSASQLLECFHLADEQRGPFGSNRKKHNDQAMHALLLALGQYRLEDISQSQAIVERLGEIYAHDPSSGIHSTTGWLLRRWNQHEVVTRVDTSPIPYDKSGHREWFVEEFSYRPRSLTSFLTGTKKLHFTFVVFPAGRFTMGSSPREPGHNRDEDVHPVDLARPIAVCDREVQWSQWVAMEGTRRRDDYARQFHRESPPENPAFGVSWYDAVRYCRWLTEQSGRPEVEQCYSDPAKLTKDDDGNPIDWPLRLDGSGFRLLTEAEWENACRNGTRTSYFFGDDASLLPYYAWFDDSSSSWSHRVAEAPPNQRGLFDIHGNVMEWCHDYYSANLNGVDAQTGPKSGTFRVVRGGSFDRDAEYCRSAWRNMRMLPTSRTAQLGFRIAFVPGKP